ncbi:mandelate racemase/muconate lactonizing enzyme family protein [Jiangella asiatica]|uniref:Mandelate racemase/muconate lactonizing enzyme family protein n=1 Tax=Jiangella asiatica TaxID=2530372 RepID=A0A4R5DRK0_9ACTN|nr:mandelate racemase/muconate lactonizing enzyme family protein [Jiangella asiatica]TDE14934.1 mandelate racemase/muconate lactonizing enzyme family protein [Jiangella asiatica]
MTFLNGVQIAEIRPVIVGATEGSNWFFVEVVSTSGVYGVGEATLNGRETTVSAVIAELAPRLLGFSVLDDQVFQPLTVTQGMPLTQITPRSGIEMALWDLRGKLLGRPVVDLLGGRQRRSVRLYANVNRSLLADRSPAAFAAAAGGARDAGFTAVKCAPFDGVSAELLGTPEGDRLVDEGLTRLSEVRRELGADFDLFVDCHGRFGASAHEMVDPIMATAAPAWIESLLGDDEADGWRSVQTPPGVLKAAGETLATTPEHLALFDEAKIDVTMPDVVYVGGIKPLHDITRAVQAAGHRSSPHCPHGPVAVLASLHAMCAAPDDDLLEYAVEGVPWRSALVGDAEVFRDGCLVLSDRPGLGIELDRELVRRHPARARLRPLGAQA